MNQPIEFVRLGNHHQFLLIYQRFQHLINRYLMISFDDTVNLFLIDIHQYIFGLNIVLLRLFDREKEGILKKQLEHCKRFFNWNLFVFFL